jgi:hypothetical protein
MSAQGLSIKIARGTPLMGRFSDETNFLPFVAVAKAVRITTRQNAERRREEDFND